MNSNSFSLFWSALIPALSGLLAGIIGSLIAPWVNWGIEKRRERQKRRQEVVRKCRELIDSCSKQSFRETQEYRYLRPLLSEKAIEHIESDTKVWARPPGQPDPLRQAIIEGIERLEKHWGLI